MTISRFITRSPSMLQLLFCMTCLNLISYSFFQICLRAPLVSDFCFAPVGFFCHSLRSHICLLSVQSKASLVAQTVKCLPALWETRVQSLSQEDPLEKEMATHSSILAWKILWMEEPGGLQSMGLQRVRYGWETSLSFFFSLVHSKNKVALLRQRMLPQG